MTQSARAGDGGSPRTGPVGVIGLGIMGSAMSANLAKGGIETLGYDVVAERREALATAGGKPLASVREVVRAAPILLTSLPSAEALLEVACEITGQKVAAEVLIETSTLPIAVKEEAHDLLAAQGIVMLDCPLSGTGAQARTKDLAVYASGLKEAYERCIPAFEGFARTHYYLGPFGDGSKMKFLANLLVAIHNISAAEALVLAQKAGLDLDLAVKVLGDGAGASRMLQVRGPMMAKGDYRDATMKVSIWQKDMKIIGEFARSLDCPVPLFNLSGAIYNAAMAQGFAEQDTASVLAVLEALAGMKRGKE
ncbi:MAG TPA: NAD(P)-dependent oxidoreductase [Usitatibacter sp.]|nr:NAD(P)-dependent oxidoreductase [Usitatibacter sp.]